jgi:hypothetical protein
LLAEPRYVTFDGVANPGCADSIDRGRADEISVEHNSLLSWGRFRS